MISNFLVARVEEIRALIAERDWGWWRLLKTAFAMAHLGAVFWVAVSLVAAAFPGPGPHDPDAGLGGTYQIIALGLLGLPWSLVVLFALAGEAIQRFAFVHRWVMPMIFFCPALLNNAGLWFLAVGDKDRVRPTETRGVQQ